MNKTLADVADAFANLTEDMQEWANANIPTVEQKYEYYRNHWSFRGDHGKVNVSRAINDTYSAFVALKENTYGYRD